MHCRVNMLVVENSYFPTPVSDGQDEIVAVQREGQHLGEMVVKFVEDPVAVAVAAVVEMVREARMVIEHFC